MQNRILCVHDLAGVGRCSLTVALPVLSAMGHEAACLPTTVLSTHTGGFGAPAAVDLTAHCLNALAHYKREEINFNCIYSGYLANAAQLEICETAVNAFTDALYVCDPVMGDGGKMYSTLPPDMALAFRKIAEKANILTPNETETALLLGLSPTEKTDTAEKAHARLNELAEICGGNIVITGLCLENGAHVNACRTKNGEAKLLSYHEKGGAFHGTGDIFTSVLCGAILKDMNFFSGVELAAAFTAKCCAQASADGAPKRNGVPFEKLLHTLV